MYCGYCEKIHLPDYPVYLSGYPRDEKTDNVHLAPKIRALTIETGGTKICFCVVDTILVTSEMTDQVRQKVCDASDFLYENIHLMATHTHSAPCIAKMNLPDPPMDENWREKTVAGCIETVIRSAECRKECDCYYNAEKAEGIYGNRNDPCGEENKSMFMFSFYAGDELLGRFINLSCHNTVNSTENKISSDLFGGIALQLEKDGTFCMITNGFSGDISTRLYRQGNDTHEIDRVSGLLSDQILKMERGKKIEAKNLRNALVCTHAYQNFDQNLRAVDRYQILQKKKEEDRLCGWEDFILESYEIRHKIGKFHHLLETSIVKMDSYVFVTMPAEPVAHFDSYIRSRFPDITFVLLGTCNGYAGYLVADDRQDDFEAEMAEVTVKDAWRHVLRVCEGVAQLIFTDGEEQEGHI